MKILCLHAWVNNIESLELMVVINGAGKEINEENINDIFKCDDV